jgi:hypothetical protein
MSASAVEFKTLVARPNQTVALDVLPTDIVTIVAKSNNQGGISLKLPDDYTFGVSDLPGEQTFTGIKQIQVISANGSLYYASFKIVPKEEATAVGPTSVLVLPENAQGNYDLMVESSSDMVTWTTFYSQSVQSNTTSRMFRVRIVKK